MGSECRCRSSQSREKDRKVQMAKAKGTVVLEHCWLSEARERKRVLYEHEMRPCCIPTREYRQEKNQSKLKERKDAP